jgi:hypothetical protein
VFTLRATEFSVKERQSSLSIRPPLPALSAADSRNRRLAESSPRSGTSETATGPRYLGLSSTTSPFLVSKTPSIFFLDRISPLESHYFIRFYCWKSFFHSRVFMWGGIIARLGCMARRRPRQSVRLSMLWSREDQGSVCTG